MKNLFYLFLFCLCNTAYSQSLSVFDVDTTNFPIMKAKFFAFDKDGKQIRPNIGDFSITENGQERTVINVSCPSPKPPVPLSSVLVFDVSGSMDGYPLEIEKAVANSWLNMLKLGSSDCAITSFSDDNYINQDFTTNKNKLVNAINGLSIISGTDYNSAMIDPAAGGILMAKTGKHKRIIIFLTDGQPNFEPRTQEIIDAANKNDISIYCLSINMPAHHTMKEFSKQTGGLYFEYITNIEAAEKAIRKIFTIAQNSDFCEIEWQSKKDCDRLKKAKILLLKYNLEDKIDYIFPLSHLTRISINPKTISFDNVKLGNIYESKFTITAVNGDIAISNIYLDNPDCTIIENTNNIIIAQNKSATFNVQFKCNTVENLYIPIIIGCDACIIERSYIKVIVNVDSSLKNIQIISPNGGEKYLVSCDTVITWKYDYPLKKISLDFSSNNGSSWKKVTDNAMNGSFDWKNLPNTPSDQCLIKATVLDSIPNGIIDYFKFVPEDVSSMDYNNDGSKLALCCRTGLGLYNVITDKTELLIPNYNSYDALVCFSYSGDFIAYYGNTNIQDTNIYIWDVKKKMICYTIKYQDYYIATMRFSHNDKYLLYGGRSVPLKAVDWANNKEFEVFNKVFDIHSVDISSNDQTLAVSAGDNKLYLIDFKTGTTKFDLSGKEHKSEIRYLEFSADSKYLVSCSSDIIIIWDVSDGSVFKRIPHIGYTCVYYKAEFSSDGEYIGILDNDEYFRYYKIDDLSVQFEIELDAYYDFDLSPDLQNVAYSKFDIVNMTDGKLLAQKSDFFNSPTKFKICRKCNLIAGVTNDKIHFWNIDTKIANQTIDPGQSLDYFDTGNFDLSKDCEKIAYGLDAVYIYDINSGKELQTYSNINSPALAFSYDGTNVFCAGYFDFKKISVDKHEIVDIPSSFYNIDFMHTSPISNNIFISEKNRKLTMFDADNEKVLFDVPISNSQVNLNSEFSPDGHLIAFDMGDEYARILDALTGTEVIKMKPFNTNQEITLVGFSPNGEKIAWRNNNEIAIYNVNTGELICKKKFPESSPPRYWINDDDVFICTTNSISTLLFTTKDNQTLASDVSDSVFSIVAPHASANNIDMKDCLLGMVKDSVITDFIENNSSYPVRIDSIYFTGADSSNFRLLSHVLPQIINPGDKITLEFGFGPSRIGLHSADMIILTQSDTLFKKIIGTGYEPQLAVNAKIIDFGQLEIGNERTFTDTALVKNISLYPITINKITQMGPDKKQFEILSSLGSFTLQPNEERKLTLKFKPIFGGRTTGQVAFEYSGVGSPAVVGLFGTGIGGILRIANDSAYPGDTRNLKLIMEKVKPEGMSAIAPNFEATIRFQNTILASINNTNWSISNDSTYLTIKGKFGTSNEIAQIPLVVGLGNIEETAVDIINFVLKDDAGNNVDYDFESESGIFKLLGICPSGGNRFINPSGKINISSIKPNPSDNEIEVQLELVEKTGYKLIIVNSNGQTVREIFRINSNKGIASEIIEVTDLASGVYNLILQTESERISKRFLILK